MKLSVVVPTYRSPELLDVCLAGLFNVLEPENEVLVVSDFSDKQIQERAVAEKYGYKHLSMEKRQGYAHVINQGIEATGDDVVLLFNTDAKPVKMNIEDILKPFEDDDQLAVQGFKLLFPNGTIQHAGGYVIWSDTGHCGWHKPDSKIYDKHYYCPWVTGAVMAVRRKAWQEFGGFDENYWFGCEDSTFCFGCWEKGWKVLYNPAVVCTHEEGGTRKGDKLEDLDKFMVQTKFEAGNLRQKREMISRPWNDIFNAVWECNGREKKLIIERSGAMGDVLIVGSLLKSVAEELPGWEIKFRANDPCGQVLVDCPWVSNCGPKLTDPFARVVTLNTEREQHPTMHMRDAYWQELEIQLGIKIESEKPKIYSRDWDWHVILARYGQELIQFQDEKGKLFYVPYAVLHAGNTHWRSRNPTPLFWQEVAAGLMIKGFMVVTVGTESDWPIPHPKVLDLRGKTTAQELHQLIEHARVFIGPDSFPMHCAQATETPMVGVFMSTRPEYLLINDGQPKASVVPETSCRFCYERQKPPIWMLECPEMMDYQCARDLKADDVLKAVSQVINKSRVEVA